MCIFRPGAEAAVLQHQNRGNSSGLLCVRSVSAAFPAVSPAGLPTFAVEGAGIAVLGERHGHAEERVEDDRVDGRVFVLQLLQ